jgi:hypothetical protein
MRTPTRGSRGGAPLGTIHAYRRNIRCTRERAAARSQSIDISRNAPGRDRARSYSTRGSKKQTGVRARELQLLRAARRLPERWDRSTLSRTAQMCMAGSGVIENCTVSWNEGRFNADMDMNACAVPNPLATPENEPSNFPGLRRGDQRPRLPRPPIPCLLRLYSRTQAVDPAFRPSPACQSRCSLHCVASGKQSVEQSVAQFLCTLAPSNWNSSPSDDTVSNL